MADLDCERILVEPVAAALNWGIDICKGNKTKTILIFDFGGGTLDVTIIKLKEGCFDVLAIAGDLNLGGQDIDNALVKYIFDVYEEEFKRDRSKNPKILAKVKLACKDLKEALSGV